MKLWFITRSLYPHQPTGGGQIRYAQIENLKKLGWDVHVVMPNFLDKSFKNEENVVQIPFFHIQKIASLFEKVGIYEDYLDRWVAKAYDYLVDKVQSEDIIFATSGGELASIKLGALLKKERACKLVVNFHDPIVYTLVNGLKVDNKPHISREKIEKKYISNADLIITSSKSFQTALQLKYPFIKEKIVNNYFGYMHNVDLKKYRKKSLTKLHIAYSGSMRGVQKPELLYQALELLSCKEQVKLYFIGDSSLYPPVRELKGVTLIPYMPHEEFLEFMREHIDVGFVSLANDYLGVCVPSKIYEYINLGLPILGALPNGDAKDMINSRKYGVASYHDDIRSLSQAIEQFLNSDNLLMYQENILREKKEWSMENKMLYIDTLLRGLL